MEEKAELKVVETEIDETSLLTPAELAMLMKGEIETPTEEPSATIEAQKEEVKEAPKTEAPIEVKKDDVKQNNTKAVLEELLGLKRPEAVPVADAKPLSEEQKRIAELENQIAIRKEMDLLQRTLESLPEEEASLIVPEVVKLIESDLYEQLRNQPVEKRVASLITYARGLQADALKEAMVKKKESESVTRKENEGLAGVKGTANEVDLRTQNIKNLQQLALSGDRDASAELLGLTDPALEELIKQSL